MTDLKDKAVKIQGKDYVLVKDRILAFNELYPNGFIQTELVSSPTDDRIVIKATIIPDSEKLYRSFTGYSQAVVGNGYINKTSALENAETSAVGRALAMMGIGVIDSVASADEVNKAMGSDAVEEALSDDSGLTMKCKIHGEVMTERMSKKGTPYFAHSTRHGLCFGKA